MRPLYRVLALCTGFLMGIGQLQAGVLLNDTTTLFLADPPITDELGIQDNPVKRAWAYGSVFEVKEHPPGPDPLTVTSLGFYDAGRNGLVESHSLYLFHLVTAQNNPGEYALIAKATVPGNEDAPLIGDYRYASIAPLNLIAGDLYLLLASVGTVSGGSPLDPFAQLTEPVKNVANGGPLNNNFVEGNANTFEGFGKAKTLFDLSTFAIGQKLYNPTSGVDITGQLNNNTTTIVQPGRDHPFLVNLEFNAAVSSVPEPATVVPMASGLVLLVAYGWRQKKRARLAQA